MRCNRKNKAKNQKIQNREFTELFSLIIFRHFVINDRRRMWHGKTYSYTCAML